MRRLVAVPVAVEGPNRGHEIDVNYFVLRTPYIQINK